MFQNAPGLTMGRRDTLCAAVSAGQRFLTVLFSLALWLGALQHCNLEAAGILTSGAEAGSDAGCCSGSEAGCETDHCNVVESGACLNVDGGVTLHVPEFSCCECLICLNVAFASVADRERVPVDTSFDLPLNWVPTWQFVQRAALLPGAPSLDA